MKRRGSENTQLPADQWVPGKDSVFLNRNLLGQEVTNEDHSLDKFSTSSAKRLQETLQQIDNETHSAYQWPKRDWMGAVILGGLLSFAGTSVDPSMKALAQEAEAAATGGFGPGEISLLLAPAFLYALFTIYRVNNPRGDFGNFMLGVVGFAIVANIVGILAFKTRLF